MSDSRANAGTLTCRPVRSGAGKRSVAAIAWRKKAWEGHEDIAEETDWEEEEEQEEDTAEDLA